MKIQLAVLVFGFFVTSSSQYEVTQNVPHQSSGYQPANNDQSKKLEFTPDLSHFHGMYPKATLQDLGEVSHGQDDGGKVIKVTRTYAIKVPVPYPVKIQKNVPYPVPVPKPYPVHVTKIVKVSQPVPVEVPVPVKVPTENYHQDFSDQSSSSYGYDISNQNHQNYQPQEVPSTSAGHYDSNSAGAMYYPQLNEPQVAYIMPTFHGQQVEQFQHNMEQNQQLMQHSNYPNLDLYSILSQIQQMSTDTNGEYSMQNYHKRDNKINEKVIIDNQH